MTVCGLNAAIPSWIRRYIRFHGKRHPSEMGRPEVEAYLTHLAVERSVAASTQNQALNAILLLDWEVLAIDLPGMANVVRAKRPERIPEGLSREEVAGILAHLSGNLCFHPATFVGPALR